MIASSDRMLSGMAGPSLAGGTHPDLTRFTVDGEPALEAHLARICSDVRSAILQALPPGKVQALLLGGGYGRGEGGVLSTPQGELPYNDLEFYVALRGSRLLNERLHSPVLTQEAHRLSAIAGIEVEFKIVSLDELRRGDVTMFSYDLVAGHRRVHGGEHLLAGCEHHCAATHIPSAEAARLLLNRCSGLLFARERLARADFTADDADFVGRNLAKARLALGDAVLAVFGRYHWSCRERQRRLQLLVANEDPPACFAAVRRHHKAGVAFKLRPNRSSAPPSLLLVELDEVSGLARDVWLWLESRRLGRSFTSECDYVFSGVDKCPGTPRWRNLLLHLQTFGSRGLLAPPARRYPRARLFDALALLLWQPNTLQVPRFRREVQAQLRTPARNFAQLVAAYEDLWRRFR